MKVNIHQVWGLEEKHKRADYLINVILNNVYIKEIWFYLLAKIHSCVALALILVSYKSDVDKNFFPKVLGFTSRSAISSSRAAISLLRSAISSPRAAISSRCLKKNWLRNIREMLTWTYSVCFIHIPEMRLRKSTTPCWQERVANFWWHEGKPWWCERTISNSQHQ